MNKIGTVIHFYDKISVAVVLLTESLRVGERIKFVRGGEDLFEETVESLQIEHNQVEEANSGDEAAIKTNQRVKEGAEVYKV